MAEGSTSPWWLAGGIVPWLLAGGKLGDIFGRKTDWAMDPADYAKGFTDLNAGNNQFFMGQIGNYLKQATDPSLYSGVQSFLQQMQQGTAPGQEYLTKLSNPLGAGGWMNQFLASAPELQGLVQGSTSGLEKDLLASQRRWTSQAVGDIANELAPMGGAYSSAVGRLAAKDVSDRAADSWLDIGQLQANLTGNLWNSAMGGLQGGAVNAANLGQNQMGMNLNALLGMAQNMQNAYLQGAGTYGGMYNPEWVAPGLETQPSVWDQILGPLKDILGIGSQVYGMAGGGFGGGAGAGAGFGGAF